MGTIPKSPSAQTVGFGVPKTFQAIAMGTQTLIFGFSGMMARSQRDTLQHAKVKILRTVLKNKVLRGCRLKLPLQVWGEYKPPQGPKPATPKPQTSAPIRFLPALTLSASEHPYTLNRKSLNPKPLTPQSPASRNPEQALMCRGFCLRDAPRRCFRLSTEAPTLLMAFEI